MHSRDRGSRWTVTLIGLLTLLIAAGGTAIAGKKNYVEEGWLGVYIQDVDREIQEDWDLPSDDGVMIDDVVDDSPAEEAGLENGDVVLKYDGNEVTSSSRFRRMIRKTEPDTEVKLEILRDGETRELTVTIGERDEDYTWNFDEDDFHINIPRIVIPNIPRIQTHSYRNYRSSSHGWVGVGLSNLNDQLGEYFGVEDGRGALIESVVDDSPAEKAGLAAGDVIIEINDEKIYDVNDVVDEISDLDEGDEAKIVVLRKGSEKTFSVEVEENDDWSDDHVIIRHSPRPDPRPRIRGFSWFDEDDREELEEELEEVMEELRDELEEVRRELKEVLEELEHGG